MTENCVMPRRHKANIPVQMLSDSISCPLSDWAIEPCMLESGVIAARMLLSNSHEEMVAHVCNYSSRSYNLAITKVSRGLPYNMVGKQTAHETKKLRHCHADSIIVPNVSTENKIY